MVSLCKTCGNPRPHRNCDFCIRLYKKDWRLTYPERHRAYNDRKRAATPEMTPEEMCEIEEIYMACRAITLATGVEHHVDHIIPISRGGKHVPDNLQIITAKENLMKSDKYEAGKTDVEPNKQQISDEMIMKICHVLAGRYRKSDQYEDLVSEGLLACYECKGAGKNRKADYVGAARRAMNDYINIKSKAVSIPSTWTSRTVSRILSDEGDHAEDLDGVSGGTFSLLMSAMSNTTEDVSETMCATEDHTKAYEDMEYYAHVMSVAITTLDQDEWQVIRMRYYDDMTQNDVADVLGQNQVWVFRVEKRALGKLKEWLV